MEYKIDISVVVPVYNVEEYLVDCFESLLHQGNIRYEVIVIDDGSTDHSGKIAQKYAEQYPEFRYYKIENNGLGHARNYGIRYATGKYIAFVDSDDIVVENTYEKMLFLAELNASELTICNVKRFKSKKVWNSGIHNEIFKNDVLIKTHISQFPQLIYDTTAWNKLILREFYLKHQFFFPEKIVYEDIPITIPMHYLANNVSILNSVGYLWRIRDGAISSITQNNSSLKNLKDRITALEMLDNFFDKNVKEQFIHEAKQRKVLNHDLMIFIDECCKMPYEQALAYISIINTYIDKSIDKKIIDSLSLIKRQKYNCVLREDFEALVEVFKYQDKYNEVSIEEIGGGVLKARLPDYIFTIASRDVTKELADSAPRKYIDAIAINNNGILEISAHIYRRRINVSDFSEQEIEAFLFDELTNHMIPMDVYPEKKGYLTKQVGTIMDVDSGTLTNYNYDGTGFKIITDLGKIDITNDQFVAYKVLVKYKNRFSEGKVLLEGCDKNVVDANQNLTVVKGTLVARIKFSYMNELQVHLKNENVFLQEISVKNGQVSCTLSNDVRDLWMMEEGAYEKIYFKSQDKRSFCAEKGMFKKNSEYQFFIKTQDLREKQLLCKNRVIKIYGGANFVIVGKSTETSAMRLQMFEHITYIRKIEKQDKKFTFFMESTGQINMNSKKISAKLYVDDKLAQKQVILAETQCIEQCGQISCKFEVDFNDCMITKDFYQSLRELCIEYKLSEGTLYSENIYSTNFFKERILFETLEIQIYRIAKGIIRIKMIQLWKEEESSQQKRDVLIFKNYPKYREEPINSKRILFESMWGSKYNCNPQALYEYIDSNYPEFECIWSLNDARTPVKGRAKRVRRGSQEYYYYLATAKYFVNNVNFETSYVKRTGQINIQTMHGTPLKTLGLDVLRDFPTQQLRDEFISKNKRWDYLIVQGIFVKKKAKKMFECRSKILTTGYPRTDRLFAFSENDAVDMKKKLNLPINKKIILYAPTWRVRNRFDMMLDLDRMRGALSEEYILLIRLHHLTAAAYIVPEDRKFIFDLTSYQYVEDLYNISDILITDYSSVMFDFALLNKPMIFYVYDIEEYSEHLRGMYIDFKNEAPGPLAHSTDELVRMIQNIDSEVEKCKKKMENFMKKFLTYEKENSCELIVKRVFQPSLVLRLFSWILQS